MEVIAGIDALDGVAAGAGTRRADRDRLFIVVGVFDGLHRGHAYLLRRLVEEAARHAARPAVITFDSHPDEVLTGTAPPLLVDQEERLVRLAQAGVEVTIVQHFDEPLRATAYDTFVERIRAHVRLAGFLMTPDAAFGYRRAGTPATLADLGRTVRPGFDVAVVPTFTVGGTAVRSSDIRAAIAAGDLAGARRLLGRAHAVVGSVAATSDDVATLSFEMPVALPPDGEYAARVGPPYRGRTRGRMGVVRVGDGRVMVTGLDRAARTADGRLRVAFAGSAVGG